MVSGKMLGFISISPIYRAMLALNRNVRYLGGTSPSLVAVSRAGFSPAKRTLYSAQRLYATEWLQVQHFRTYNHEGIAFFDK